MGIPSRRTDPFVLRDAERGEQCFAARDAKLAIQAGGETGGE